MAQKQGLTAKAEELSRKLAAARLRAPCCRSGTGGPGGWDEGLTLRQEARARLGALDGEVLAGADEQAGASRRLADAELRFRSAQAERSDANRAFRLTLDREASATQALASQAGRAAASTRSRRSSRRPRGTWSASCACSRERELEEAEAAFRDADQHRREVDELRRQAGEQAVGRRVEVEALERSSPRGGGARASTTSSGRSGRRRRPARGAEAIESEIEGLDGQTSPLAERAASPWRRRRRATEKVEELEEIERRQQARLELLEARRRYRGDGRDALPPVPSRPGGGRPAGCSARGDRARAGAAGGARPAGRRGRLRGPPRGGRRRGRRRRDPRDVAAGGAGAARPVRRAAAVVRGRGRPGARGIVSTVLRDVYLASSIAEAADKQAAHPDRRSSRRTGRSWVRP